MTVTYACANCEYRWQAPPMRTIDLTSAHCPACGIRRALQPNVYRPDPHVPWPPAVSGWTPG